MKVMIKLPEQ